MEPKTCALPGCENTIGVVPWRIYNRAGDYCSRACTVTAFEDQRRTKKKTQKEDSKMRIPAEDFGDSGVVRHVCSRSACGEPLGLQPDGTAALAWKGRYGEYCSNDCLKLCEEQGEEYMTEATETTTPAKPPIVAGAETKKTLAKAAKRADPSGTKKPATKTNKAPAKPKKDPSLLFRPGCHKDSISKQLINGKYHTIEDLKKLCDKLKTGHNQIKFTLAEMVSRGGFTVEYRADGAEVRVKK